MRSRRKERRKGISETDIREIIESWLELVRSPGRNDAGMYTRRSSAPWKHQSLPFSGCFQRCFPANRLRSNIKISGRKHALAYKRDFPLSRAPLEGGEKRSRKTKGGTFFSPPRRNKFANEKERRISISPPRRSLLDTTGWKYSNYICLDLFFFFFPRKNFNAFEIYFWKFVVYNGYTWHAIDHWKINTRCVCIISIYTYFET